MLLSEGQMGQGSPRRQGYDADCFRAALAKRVVVCIPSKPNRKVAIPYDAIVYKQRHKIETCLDGSKTGAASTPDTTAASVSSRGMLGFAFGNGVIGRAERARATTTGFRMAGSVG